MINCVNLLTEVVCLKPSSVSLKIHPLMHTPRPLLGCWQVVGFCRWPKNKTHCLFNYYDLHSFTGRVGWHNAVEHTKHLQLTRKWILKFWQKQIAVYKTHFKHANAIYHTKTRLLSALFSGFSLHVCVLVANIYSLLPSNLRLCQSRKRLSKFYNRGQDSSLLQSLCTLHVWWYMPCPSIMSLSGEVYIQWK